jgi:hypothetical protein
LPLPFAAALAACLEPEFFGDLGFVAIDVISLAPDKSAPGHELPAQKKICSQTFSARFIFLRRKKNQLTQKETISSV